MAKSVMILRFSPFMFVSTTMTRVWRGGTPLVVSDFTFQDFPHCFRSLSPSTLSVKPASAGLTRTLRDGNSLAELITSPGAATTGRMTSLRVFQLAGSLIVKCDAEKSWLLRETFGEGTTLAGINEPIVATRVRELSIRRRFIAAQLSQAVTNQFSLPQSRASRQQLHTRNRQMSCNCLRFSHLRSCQLLRSTELCRPAGRSWCTRIGGRSITRRKAIAACFSAKLASVVLPCFS